MAGSSKVSKFAPSDTKHKNAIPDRYRDEPEVAGSSSSAIPLLSHSDYDEDARDPDEELPGYSDNIDDRAEGNNENNGEDDPPPFAPYKPVVKKIKTKLGMGDTLTVSHDPHLNTDGEALYRYCVILQPSFF